MGTTSEPREAPADEPHPNEVPLRRSTERLHRLLPHDLELQLARPSPEALDAIRRCGTTIESIAKAFELYGDRPCLAERAFEPDGESVRLLPAYRKVRFVDVWRRVEAFASGLTHEKLVETGSFVGICGFGSIDWVVADFSCVYLAAVAVPLQTGMSPADLQQIIREAELSCMICSVEQLDSIESVLPECPSLRSIVVMDLREGERASAAKVEDREVDIIERQGGRFSMHTMKAVEASGIERGIVPMVLPSARNEPDPLMTLMYTSGSTGTPKGAMITESLLNEQWHSGFFARLLELVPDFPMITVNYMPLNHAAGRGSLHHSLVGGGTTYFVAKSDMSTLFDDIRLARPTSLLLVPRVAGMVYQHFQGEVVRRAAAVTTEHEREAIAERIMAEMRSSFLGDRILLAITGSAPTPPDVVDFLRRCFDIPVIDGYGSTEAGPLTFDNRIDPGVRLEWKLVDVPELGYRTTDEPHPRGLLRVKSRFLVPGYYKNERATKELFDEDGFLDTGDIVEQRGPYELHWIDRAKNILKLAQGEYVATSRLEGLFASRSSFIRQIYVYGNGHRSYLLAVVVPDLAAASAHLKQQGLEPDDAALKQLVRSEVNRVARDESLRGYEVPRDFIVEREPFTYENDLLTASSKPSRPKLRARYGERLEALYAEIERAQLHELQKLQAETTTASTADTVKKAIEATLGVPDIDLGRSGHSFIQLGGDSLSAVSAETLIEDLTGVHVPVGLLLDPTSSIGAVISYVEEAASGKGRRAVTFEEVHGKGAKSVHASDLRIEKFLAPDEIEAARRASRRSDVPPHAQAALLTGANGFLGRFLALELLERLAADGTRVYAIVRAPNDEAAALRLARSYQADPSLVARFEELSGNGRLRVLAGDLMKPRFGLTEDTYERLAGEVDLVLHNGALVNHAFTYEQLFEPNVLGTVEALRFALAGRAKSIAYVSTVGAAMGLQRTEPLRESEDVRSLFSARGTDSGYAVGYGTSKWATEVLLRDAHEKLGVPVTVFRPAGIMTHTRYRGQVNVPDFFTRLLAGLVYTGIAPRTFYSENAPDRAKHYDGEPVDVVARAIALISTYRLEAQPRYETVHVVNPHWDDGISLDVIVSWVKSAGYPVERIADYDAWYRTFHDRLMGLSEPQKHHSPLPILQAWQRPLGEGELLFDATQLLERLRAIASELGELPHVNEPLIHKYLDDMAQLEVIAPRHLQRTGT